MNNNAIGFAGFQGLISNVDELWTSAIHQATVMEDAAEKEKDVIVNPPRQRSDDTKTLSFKGQSKNEKIGVFLGRAYRKIRSSPWTSIGITVLIIYFILMGLSNNTSPISSHVIEVKEEKPPVGKNNTLYLGQVYYCRAEKKRLGFIKEIAETEDLASDSVVDQWNNAVADYNSRCSSYRYRKGILRSADTKVQNNIDRIRSEARVRLMLWSNN